MRRPILPLHTGDIRALSRDEVVSLIKGLTDLLASYDRVGEAA